MRCIRVMTGGTNAPSVFNPGDRVRIEAPGNAWDGETGTVAEIWPNGIRPLVIVRMDNRELCFYSSGLNAISRTFLRLIEDRAQS